MAPADVPEPGFPFAANDNGDADGPDPEDVRKVNDVVMQIGRRMAREDFAARMAAANDNMLKGDDGTDDNDKG